MATAKKATPKTEGTKYMWAARPAYEDSIFDDFFWNIGQHVSLESAVNSDAFQTFMTDNDNPEEVYMLALTENGKPHHFYRIAVKQRLVVKQSGYTFKEV